MTKNTRILVVDRDVDFVNELTNFLLAGGYSNIESVNSYRDAFTRLKQNHFDIVLMEIFAPDMKGLEYVREIRHLKPEIKTFLMIEPELQPVVNGKTKGKLKFDCLIKSSITQDFLDHLKD